ncbi:ABC transporter ATP-binding protein [Polaromonas sp. YR568]|uniref:ABC transporter ATP-binding protein n=1 Tax=Polaromonas sp. YR568 TaxID=1855301 RepID=UPI0031378BC3
MLQVRQLVKHFGGVHAVDGVSFEVQPGDCVALIGPNGAGKSTTFACIAGQYPATSGQVLWKGQALDRLTPAQRLRQGVGRTFQVAQVFEALTALQNVQLAMEAADGAGGTSERGARSTLGLSAGFRRLGSRSTDAAMALLTQTGLQAQASVDALNLPYGAKKRLELAMALAARPQLLLLDEPAAGLAEEERARLMALVKQVAAQGMAVLYTEHNMDAVAGMADRVLVLIEGRLVAEGPFEVVARDPVVRARYLGESSGAVIQPAAGVSDA